MLQAFPFDLTWKAKDAVREGLDAFNILSARAEAVERLCAPRFGQRFLNYGVAIGLARLKRLRGENGPQISGDPLAAKGKPRGR